MKIGCVTILLTACIDPSSGSSTVTRSNPSIRLQDYCNALAFWLGVADSRLNKLVFIDNSGYPLDEIHIVIQRHNKLHKECEVLQTKDNWCPAGVQYGYAELGMVDFALKSSRLLAQSKYFIKATGRLTFPKIGRLLDRIPDNLDFAVEARDFKLGRNHRQFVTTQLALFQTRFYRDQLLGIRDQMKRDGPDTIEKLFYQKLVPRSGSQDCLLRFPTNCDPSGMAAHGSKSYDSVVQSFIRRIRGIGRVVAPSVWF